jgi:SPP1 gp7 family putative phage head morphogenesis protein
VDKLKLGAGKKFMGQARVALQRDMKKVYKKAFDEAKAEIKRFEKEQNFAKPNATRVDSSELKDSASEVIDSRAFNAIGNLNDEILGRAQTTLINGIEQGVSTNEIVNNLDTVFNPVVFGAATAELSATPALLETIVRTNFTNIANMARKQVARSTDIGEFVWGFEYSAILDSRTTEICNRLDGTRAKKDDPIWDRITPSNHFNCRSILRYITQFDVEEDDVKPSKKPNLDSLRKLPGAKSNSGDFF